MYSITIDLLIFSVCDGITDYMILHLAMRSKALSMATQLSTLTFVNTPTGQATHI